LRSSMNAAKAILRSRGFEIIGERVPIRRSGFEISDVDLMASKEGELYAVEVKSGRLDVGGVRQAYVNSLLVNAKPLVVCRGFADPSAEILAKELGVEVIVLEDLFLSDPEELRSIIREEIRRGIMEVLPAVINPPELEPTDLDVLKAIASTEEFRDAAESLKISEDDLGRELGRMRLQGKIPRWVRDYSELREWAISLLKSHGVTFSRRSVDKN